MLLAPSSGETAFIVGEAGLAGCGVLTRLKGHGDVCFPREASPRRESCCPLYSSLFATKSRHSFPDETRVSLKKARTRSGAGGFSQGVMMESEGAAFGPKPWVPPAPDSHA